jgi:hypothetical protein
MSNPFAFVGKALKWLGKEIGDAATWFPRIVKTVDDVETDIPEDFPLLITVLNDVEALGLASIKDGMGIFVSLEALITVIKNASAVDGLNVATDEQVVMQVKNFIAEVTSKASYSDVISAVGKLITDYDSMKAAVVGQLQTLESDVSGKASGMVSTIASPTPSTVPIPTEDSAQVSSTVSHEVASGESPESH